MGMSTAVWQLLRRLPLPSASSKDVRHWSVDWRRLLLWRSLLLEMALLLLLLLLVSTGRAVNWSIRAVAGRIGDEAELLEPGATVDVDGVDGAAGGGAGGAVVVGAAVLWLKIVPGEDKISRV